MNESVAEPAKAPLPATGAAAPAREQTPLRRNVAAYCESRIAVIGRQNS